MIYLLKSKIIAFIAFYAIKAFQQKCTYTEINASKTPGADDAEPNKTLSTEHNRDNRGKKLIKTITLSYKVRLFALKN